MVPRHPRNHPAPDDRVSILRVPGTIIQGILARAALVFLRVYLGLLFLLSGAPKLREDFAPNLSAFLTQVGLTRGHEFYRDVIRQLVLPNLHLFAMLIPWGELLVGLTLVLGAATRLSAAVALVLLVNCMLAKGAWFWYPSSNDAALAAIAVALIIGAAGRTFGVDALLARRWPRSPLW
jgi:thiosulfate dehydrogenase [quinone] large subunit